MALYLLLKHVHTNAAGSTRTPSRRPPWPKVSMMLWLLIIGVKALRHRQPVDS